MRPLLLCLALCVASSAHANSSIDSDSAVESQSSSKDEKSSREGEALAVVEPVAQVNSGADVTLNRSGGASRAAWTKAELCRTAASEAAAKNLPAHFFTNLIQQESGFRLDVVSRAGAQGIAQFMPPVASSYGLANPFEPVAALKASAKLLSDLVERFGNLGLAAAAYNAGPKRVLDWMEKRRKLPAETRHYVYRITGRPAEHWTNQRTKDSEIALPTHAHCSDLPIIALSANPIASAARKIATRIKREVRAVNLGQEHFGAKGATDRNSKVAIIFQRPTSQRAQASNQGSTMSRFVAMPTPIIMAAEKNQPSHYADAAEKKRPNVSLPRPSEFIVGARVPAAIKASEAAALARSKTPAQWAHKTGTNRTHVADATSKPQRKS